jgi:hypothetical protein
MISNLSKSGKVVIAFADTDGLRSKTLADIKFHVLADDVSPLKLESVELYRSDATPINPKPVDGKFSSWNMPPEHTALLQNFPNPFNADTWIPYQLKVDSVVTIRIYSLAGRLVRELNLGLKPDGVYISRDRAAHWDGRNGAGEQVSSGLYFYTIQAGHFTATKKMIIAK